MPLRAREHTAQTGEAQDASPLFPAALLRSLETQHREATGKRIAVIEQALAMLADERIDEASRHDAVRAAHMLAGSVGMFGCTRAAEAARELEAELPHAGPDRARALMGLLRALRHDTREHVR